MADKDTSDKPIIPLNSIAPADLGDDVEEQFQEYNTHQEKRQSREAFWLVLAFIIFPLLLALFLTYFEISPFRV